MTIEQLEAYYRARPFRPFRLHLADGTSVHVPHPEFLSRTPGGRTITVYTGPESAEILDLLLVTKITVGNGSRAKRNGKFSRRR
jgi:hypothetical protein